VKVLVATKKTQGQRDNDFFWTEEGEIVYPGFVCGTDERYGPDGGCGCGRAVAGINSHRSTTTFEVVEMAISEDEYHARLADSFIAGGWGKDREGVAGLVKSAITEVDEILEEFEVGAILERRLHDFVERTVASE
jgi:hypothetical protein